MECKLSVIKMLSEDLEERFIDTNFLQIDEFKRVFEKDFEDEERRIKRQFDDIRSKVDHLEAIQLKNLRKSKDDFLDQKFEKIFEESRTVAEYYRLFYEAKEGFFSHYNRFKTTLENNEVSIDNLRMFNKKFNTFNE